jgi:hypothetical protein
LAKVAVQCCADTFVVNQSLVLRINICGANRHCAKRQNVKGKLNIFALYLKKLNMSKETIKLILNMMKTKIISKEENPNSLKYLRIKLRTRS